MKAWKGRFLWRYPYCISYLTETASRYHEYSGRVSVPMEPKICLNLAKRGKLIPTLAVTVVFEFIDSRQLD